LKVFQIYDGAEPPKEPYFGYMRRVYDQAKSYTLIGSVDFMGADFVPIEEVEEVVRRESGHARWERARFGDGGYHFDALRAYYLARHFDHVYLDIDVELHAPIPLLPAVQKAGPGVMVGNGNAALGLTCWQTYLRKSPNIFLLAPLMFVGLAPLDVPPHLFTHHFANGKY
jgi:hypothetical protein